MRLFFEKLHHCAWLQGIFGNPSLNKNAFSYRWIVRMIIAKSFQNKYKYSVRCRAFVYNVQNTLLSIQIKLDTFIEENATKQIVRRASISRYFYSGRYKISCGIAGIFLIYLGFRTLFFLASWAWKITLLVEDSRSVCEKCLNRIHVLMLISEMFPVGRRK